MKKKTSIIYDPLAEFLIHRVRLTVETGGLVAFLFAVVYVFVLPAVFGIVTPDSGIRQILLDFSDVAILLVITPIVWIYYLWQHESITNAFGVLETSAQNPAEMSEEIVRQRARLTRVSWHIILAVLVACGLSTLNIRISWERFGESWLTYNWEMIAAMQVIRLPAFYMATMAAIKLTLSSVLINRVVSAQSLKITLLHPDGRGGVGALGRYSITSALVVPIAGLYLGLVWAREGILALTPGGIYFPAILIYIVVAPVLLFLPILKVHEQMLAVKSRLLAEIAELFEKEYESLTRQLHQNLLAPDVAIRLRAFKKMYNSTEKAPVWPLDLSLLYQFIVAVLLPIFAPIALKVIAAWFA